MAPSLQLPPQRKTKPQLCLPAKNSLSMPFEDLGLGEPARSAKTGLRSSLKTSVYRERSQQRPDQHAWRRGGSPSS